MPPRRKPGRNARPPIMGPPPRIRLLAEYLSAGGIQAVKPLIHAGPERCEVDSQ